MDNSRLEIDFGTSQLKRPSSVTVPVNGQRLQTLRQSAGLTQEELAEKAGYSDRLIRKAEASGPLRKSTIADLADALSTTAQKVTSDDLVFSHELIARDIAAFILNGSLSPPDVLSDLLHPRFVLRVAGQDLGIPFAGVIKGASACESFRDQLNATFSLVRFLPEQTQCFVATHEPCVQATTLMKSLPTARSVESASEIWWFLKTRFEGSHLVSMEMLYDTGNVCRLLGCFQK
jgi:transcriptional regulator with XRE-family HTH domain